MYCCSWSCGLECLLTGSGRGVALVDVRGSGGQGREWSNLRTGELEDLEQAVSIISNLKYVDSTKLCFYGRDYGGYLVLKSLLANTESLSEVKCGVAVAAITDWRLGEWCCGRYC